ncbi:MAG: RAD55 family ATPase [Nanoarchaeota archaeon]
MGAGKDKTRGKKKVSSSSTAGKKKSKKTSSEGSAKNTAKKTKSKKKPVLTKTVGSKKASVKKKQKASDNSTSITESSENKTKVSKSPFAGLKQDVKNSLQDNGGSDSSINRAENDSGMQNDDALLKKKKSSKSKFAGLKENIISQLEPSKQSGEKLKKVDMAFLKSTVEESLKAPEKEKTITLPRCPTGIEGFDEIVEGGLIRDSVTLLCGGPGSGKSIFAMQNLVNGIDKYGESGVYITFEEEVETLLGDMKRFGWNLQEKIQNRQLAILAYSPEQVDRVLYIGGGPIREVIDDLNAKRIVIDSITAFTMLYNSENQRRKALLSLFNILKKWDCTALLTSEQAVQPEEHQAKLEEYQAEGIIYMYHTKKGDVRERSIEVFKMRGTDHSTKICPLKIGPGGIVVYPDESVY